MTQSDNWNDRQPYRPLADFHGDSVELHPLDLQAQSMESGSHSRREYSSADEMAAYVNVNAETFALLANDAGITPVEIGGQPMYHRTQVKEFLCTFASWGARRL